MDADWSNTKNLVCLITIVILAVFLGIFFGSAIIDTRYNSNNMFCPECGRRYENVVYCEYDGTELKEIQK